MTNTFYAFSTLHSSRRCRCCRREARGARSSEITPESSSRRRSTRCAYVCWPDCSPAKNRKYCRKPSALKVRVAEINTRARVKLEGGRGGGHRCRRDVHVEQRLISMAIPLQRFPAVSPPEADTRGWLRQAVRVERVCYSCVDTWRALSVFSASLNISLYDGINFAGIQPIWFRFVGWKSPEVFFFFPGKICIVQFSIIYTHFLQFNLP